MVNELIAVPIIADNLDDARRDMDLALKQGADILEVRFDFQKDYDPLVLDGLLRHTSLPKIYTCRHKRQAGPNPLAGFRGSEKQRSELLQQAIEARVEYFDVEFACEPVFKNTAKKSKCISSYHNFEETPNFTYLCRLFEEMFWDHSSSIIPDIVKIATRANRVLDSDRMLDFIMQKQERYPAGIDQNPAIIGLCMGENGKRTRIEGIHHGNYLTFACLEGKASADGQMSISDLRLKMAEYG